MNSKTNLIVIPFNLKFSDENLYTNPSESNMQVLLYLSSKIFSNNFRDQEEKLKTWFS
jgi:hypothetical protein